jgi:hypothetical protein
VWQGKGLGQGSLYVWQTKDLQTGFLRIWPEIVDVWQGKDMLFGIKVRAEANMAEDIISETG